MLVVIMRAFRVLRPLRGRSDAFQFLADGHKLLGQRRAVRRRRSDGASSPTCGDRAAPTRTGRTPARDSRRPASARRPRCSTTCSPAALARAFPIAAGGTEEAAQTERQRALHQRHGRLVGVRCAGAPPNAPARRPVARDLVLGVCMGAARGEANEGAG